MFGFRDRHAAAVEDVGRYLRSLVAGLGDVDGASVANRAFTDPYVVGFLQVVATHAVANVYHSGMPDENGVLDILAEALDQRAPDQGALLRQAQANNADPDYPRHEDYLDGRHDGSEHVRTFFTRDGISRNAFHTKFRDYVTRHYL